MNKNEIVENKVEKTMELYENIGQIEPDSFFYRKLENKINENSRKHIVFFPFLNSSILRPALILLLIINIVSVIHFFPTGKTQKNVEKDLKYYSIMFQADYNVIQNKYVAGISDKISTGEE